MFLLIDNYDSFTHNLAQYLGELGVEITVCRNDKFDASKVDTSVYSGVVISPGPCTPNETGHVMRLLEIMDEKLPLLGVCLGHQCLIQHLGGKIVRATPYHGKISKISHTGHRLFQNIPAEFEVTRYHSLIAETASIPKELSVIASFDEIVMAVAEKKRPRFGVQFHPESIGTPYGKQILRNFLKICAK